MFRIFLSTYVIFSIIFSSDSFAQYINKGSDIEVDDVVYNAVLFDELAADINPDVRFNGESILNGKKIITVASLGIHTTPNIPEVNRKQGYIAYAFPFISSPGGLSRLPVQKIRVQDEIRAGVLYKKKYGFTAFGFNEAFWETSGPLAEFSKQFRCKNLSFTPNMGTCRVLIYGTITQSAAFNNDYAIHVDGIKFIREARAFDSEPVAISDILDVALSLTPSLRLIK